MKCGRVKGVSLGGMTLVVGVSRAVRISGRGGRAGWPCPGQDGCVPQWESPSAQSGSLQGGRIPRGEVWAEWACL